MQETNVDLESRQPDLRRDRNRAQNRKCVVDKARLQNTKDNYPSEGAANNARRSHAENAPGLYRGMITEAGPGLG